MTTSNSGKTNKISVCITVFNEDDTIEKLIFSLNLNKKYFGELIVCDGGSTDSTIQKIKNLSKKFNWIKLYLSAGNVAHGRNVSISKSRGEIIVTTDAGCIVHKDWVKKIIKPLKDNKCDISAGFYTMKTKNSFQKALSVFRGVISENYNKKFFIPSCRSVAFSKKVWTKIGGFDEKLSLSGEDTKFFYQAIKNGYRVSRIKSALVDWVEPSKFTIGDIFKFYHYAKGDIQTGIWWDPVKKWKTHNIKIMSIFMRYIVFSLLLYLNFPIGIATFLIYLIWSFVKVYKITNDINSGFWGIFIQLSSDILIIAGFLRGYLRVS